MDAHVFERYKADRAALIELDRSLRIDHAQVLSDLEVKAVRIVRDLRARDAAEVWQAEHPDVPHPFPGMEFLTGRTIIEKTKVFKIISKMPKGALLHSHLDATVKPRRLLEWALEYPAMHIRVGEKMAAENIGSIQVLPEFRALPRDLWPEISEGSPPTSLTDASYVPGSWIALNTARESFLGGSDGFDKWVIEALSINPREAYATHNTTDKIWHKFASTFQVSGGLIHFAPIWSRYIYEFLRLSVDDGISYIETRVVFFQKCMVGADGRQNVPHREWLSLFGDAQNKLKLELKNQGREDEFVGAKMIYTALRSSSPEELEWNCQDCIELKKEFPYLIAGFDVAGPENIHCSLLYYAETLLNFRKQQKQVGVDIPLILHAGETCGDGTHADMNLYDAILLGSQRIGHGFSLVRHPKLMSLCKERNILIEVCPISSSYLQRLASSMPMHPLPILMNNGVHVSISSDDPGVFGNTGVSFDMYQACISVLAASEVTGLIALRELARDSLRFSTLESREKDAALHAWSQRWDAFVKWIVEENELA
ncbi:hypothetical protein C8F01DRAFT_983765 [Mycena amicta]|nr:hypothetical protein C8F01DRAFT_983765 [Mycena amicta]